MVSAVLSPWQREEEGECGEATLDDSTAEKNEETEPDPELPILEEGDVTPPPQGEEGNSPLTSQPPPQRTPTPPPVTAPDSGGRGNGTNCWPFSCFKSPTDD